MRNTLFLILTLAALIALGSAAAADDVNMGLTITPVPRSKIAKDKGLEARMMWFDATANLERLSTRDGVAKICDRCVEAGINAVAVGVKSPCGFALYKSKVAPRMEAFMGRFLYPKTYDLLTAAVEEGHKRGLKVYAMLMVFSEGRLSDQSGPAYRRFPSWQSILYDVKDGKPQLFPSSQASDGVFVFVNPALPDVRKYELSIMKDIVKRYDVDGIVIDRCRFDGIRADFSQHSKRAFERYLGKKVARWPQDVYTLVQQGTPTPTGVKMVWVPEWGPYYKKWLEWRASVIGDFVKEAANTVRRIKPGIYFGSVVGAWYPEYSPEGANWGSRKFDPSAKYEWATTDYCKTGYAESLDFLIPNCYGKKPWITDADANTPYWWTIQGAARMANEAVADACFVYAGVYVLDFKGRPEDFKQAVHIALEETNGVKIFDLSQIEEYNWWGVLKQALNYQVKGLPHEHKEQ